MTLDPRTPVLVGVGTCFDDTNALELMVRATERAGADSSPALLSKTQRIVVPRGTWTYRDPARVVAERIGAPDATTVLVDVGIPQQTMLDEVLALIASGELDVCVVVGAEDKAHQARAKQQSVRADAAGVADMFRSQHAEAEGPGPDIHQSPSEFLIDPAELEAGLFAPVDQYALIERALGEVEGRTVDELRREIAELYARFNTVAQANPDAAFPAPMSADDLATFAPTNRPMAFPYAKWHVTQWTVDQAAALVLCSAQAATAAGVPRDRWVFPHLGLSSSLTLPLSQRADLHRWPAMQVIGERAEQHLGQALAECEHVELYSCFPVAVRVQQRELGLPLDGTPTVTGGMSFAGGPFNSYVFQSLTAMARRLRAQGGRGIVTSVSGLLTKPGLGVWSTEPPGTPVLLADVVDEARARSATVSVVSSYDGPATIASLTVTHAGMDPNCVIVLGDLPDGTRVIAKSDDAELCARGRRERLVGTGCTISGNVVTAID